MSRSALFVVTLLASLAVVPTVYCARLLVVPLSSESHIAAFAALTAPLEILGGHEIHMVVCQELADFAARSAAERGASGHTLHTYPLRPDLFAADIAAMATAHPILAMRLGYKVLAALTERVAGNATLLAAMSALQPDLVIGDATASFGHWLSELIHVPAIEFDVGTSSALLHSLWGGQSHPAYLPAPGTLLPSTGLTLLQRAHNAASMLATKGLSYINRQHGPIAACVCCVRVLLLCNEA